MSASTFWKVGAIYGAAAVGFGAFGAHGLKKRIADPAKIDSWKTAASYQVGSVHPFIQHRHSNKIEGNMARPLQFLVNYGR